VSFYRSSDELDLVDPLPNDVTLTQLLWRRNRSEVMIVDEPILSVYVGALLNFT